MTDAIPFGIYSTATHIFRTDVRSRISSGEQCYLQLIRRASSQSYAVYVAASYSDLLSLHEGREYIEDRVIVTTISRQDFHHHCSLLAAPPAERPTYVAPDCVLKGKQSGLGKELQFFASSAWLCYFKVLHTRADGSVCIRVAALPHRVDNSRLSYVTFLSQEEYAMATQLDRKDLALATCDLLGKVEAHAKVISGRPVIERVHPPVPFEEELEQVDEDTLPIAQQPQIRELEPVFVPNTLYEQAIKRFDEANKKAEHIALSPKIKQKVWLQAVLLSLKSHKEHADRAIQETIEQLDGRVRDVLVNHLSSSQELVHSEPVHCNRRTQGYLVRIEQPIAA